MRKKDSPCLNSENDKPVMVDIAKEMRGSLLDYVKSVLAPKSKPSHYDVVRDPIQVRRDRKKSLARKYSSALCIYSILYGIYQPIQRLYSAYVGSYTIHKIIENNQELKKYSLEYSPNELAKYGIRPILREVKNDDPEDNRIMRILIKLLNKIKFSSDRLVLTA